MKLRNKLLYSFILVTSVLVVTLFFMLRWSFERGAATYVRQEDQQELAELSKDLADYYAINNSWDAFVQQPEYWYAWIDEHKEESTPSFKNQRHTKDSDHDDCSHGKGGHKFDKVPKSQSPKVQIIKVFSSKRCQTVLLVRQCSRPTNRTI